MSKKKVALIILLICVAIESMLLLFLWSVGSTFFLLGLGYVLGNAIGEITQYWLVGMLLYFGGKWIIKKLRR